MLIKRETNLRVEEFNFTLWYCSSFRSIRMYNKEKYRTVVEECISTESKN